MRKLLAVAFALMLPWHSAAPARTGDPTAAALVRNLWAELDDTWNSRDPDTFSRLFTANASFMFVNRGDSLEGREAIHERFSKQFPAQSADLRHRTLVRDVRQISQDALVMDGTIDIVRADTVVGSFAVFALMVPNGDQWQIDVLRVYNLPLEDSASED